MTKCRNARGLAASTIDWRSSLLVLSLIAGGCSLEVTDEGSVGDPEQPDLLVQRSDETICGPTTDWQDVESYDGTLGPSTAFVDRHQGAVGYIPGHCTGTLIAYNLFLTAGHCFDSVADAESLTVQFNYQDDPDGDPRTPDEYDIVDLVEHRDEALHGGLLDYAIVRLAGSPGYRWGITPVSAAVPDVGDAITLIQHPGGIPKVVEGGTISSVGDVTLSYGNLDTLGGSSGAGVLNARGHVVGVHENGGCGPTSGANAATRLDSILAEGSIMGGQDHVWLGNANETFSEGPSNDAWGTYVPIGGDFDGDGRGDIFWYGRGGVGDSVWYGDGDGTFTSVASSVGGSRYEPVAGDFDGDGRDDIFWYGPGGVTDSVWYGNANRTFTSVASSVSGSAYRPLTGDFDGDGRDDIFWYGPGSVNDSAWFGNANRTFTGVAFSVSGTAYRPVAGDFDGDGRDDIFWYGPGGVNDSIWWAQPGRTFSSEATSVSGHYYPFTGDFNGDGNDDVFWYGPASTSDFVWFADGAGGFDSESFSISGSYTPVTGRFDSNARTDIYWYRPG